MWNSSLRLRKMYFCCLTEAGNKKWPSVEHTRRRSIWLIFQAGTEFFDKTVLKRQQCCRIHIPIALVCRGKKKVRRNAETTRFVLSNDSRLHETEGRSVPDVKFKKKNNKQRKLYLTTLVEETKTIFLCFRLPLRRKWRWRAVWTLIKVLRTFLSTGQTEMPQTKKKSKWTASWRLSKFQSSLADKKFWQFWLVFNSQSYYSIKCSNWIGYYLTQSTPG